MNTDANVKIVTDKNERCKIVNFLEQLVERYRSKQLPVEDEKRVTEFYIKERFLQACKDDQNEKDPLTYLALGWYIYEELYKNDTNKNENE